MKTDRSEYGDKEAVEVRDAYAKEAPRTIWIVFTRVVVPIIAISCLVSVFWWAIKIATAPAAVAEKMADPDNMIYNVEWFRTQANQIDAIKRQAITSQGELDAFEKSGGPVSGYSYAMVQEHSRLTANVTGLKNQCQSMAADYNAHSKMVTRSIFKGGDLPETEVCP